MADWRPYKNLNDNELIDAYEKETPNIWWLLPFLIILGLCWKFLGGFFWTILITLLFFLGMMVLVDINATTKRTELRKEIERRIRGEK